MRTSSSTFSFKRYFLSLVIGFYSVFLLSSVLFVCKPHLFYWRAWEFFSEIVYNTPHCNLIWKQEESGDFSRKYAFTLQNKWKTIVSCDAEGFRSVPYHTDHYQAFVVGDSHIWGSGLSDQETLPWKLAEALQIPIFNGAKSSLSYLLGKESLKEASLILELFQAPLFNKKNIDLIIEEQFTVKTYKPLTAKQLSFWDIFTPQRYFIPAKIFRFFSLERLMNSVRMIIAKSSIIEKPAWDNGKTLGDLECIVTRIVDRAKAVNKLGHDYVFIPVPTQQFVVSEKVTQHTLWWESELIRRLKEQNVHAIDLTTLFRKHRKEGIYFDNDSHWNAKGVELALTEIIPYLHLHELLKEGL